MLFFNVGSVLLLFFTHNKASVYSIFRHSFNEEVENA